VNQTRFTNYGFIGVETLSRGMTTGYSVDGPDLSGEVELADGETVVIPRPDKVFPTFG